jgi:cytochrome c553
MGSRVAPLSDREIEHIATYFSSLPCTFRRFAANPAARAPALAQRCAFCHSPQGTNLYADAPNLAGQKMEYLMRQLGKLRRSAIGIVTTDTAERFHRTMAPAVYDLTDTDIAQIANYFSSQSCRATN